MQAWVDALSLKVALFAALLALVSLQLAEVPPTWSSIAAIFCITVSTMLQNDWRDRVHDVRKGEVLVMEHTRAFLMLVLSAWAVSFTLVLMTMHSQPQLGAFLACVALVGLLYSEIRRVPMLPILLVALTSASPVLFPLMHGHFTVQLGFLYGAAFWVIFAREITRDIEDMRIDPGYKWTLPVAYGEARAVSLASGALLLGVAMIVQVSLWCVPGTIIAACGIHSLRQRNTLQSRLYVDAGMAMVLCTLLLQMSLDRDASLVVR